MSDVVVCLANRRWSCWYDRSQQLMSQCAQERTVVFVEEPEFDSSGPDVEMSETRTGVITLIPHMPAGLTLEAVERAQRRALDFVLAHLGAHEPVLWYYAPHTISFTDHIDASAKVYDCLRARRSTDSAPLLEPAGPGRAIDSASPQPLALGRRHQRLLETADVVFTPETPTAQTWPELWRTMWSQVERVIGYQRVACSPAPESLSPLAP